MRYHAVPSLRFLSAAWRPLVRTALLFAAVLSLTFALLHLAPGDASTLLLPPGASPADAARLRAHLGLDQPVGVQYARWLGGTLRGDLGMSFAERRPVRDVLRDALPVSLALGGLSLALSFAIGIVVGLVQAAQRGSRTDLALTTASVVLASAPAYWMGLAAIACFTYVASMLGFPGWLRLPAIGMSTPGAELHGVPHLLDLARHAILPVSLLAAIGAAGVARYARSSALDVIQSDWIRTARAKGLRESAVLRRHLLANLRAPLITLFALALPGTVAGSVFIETIFGWPGMGRTMVTAIVARDYPVVLGSAAAYGAIVILANLAAELALPWADPRLRP